MCSVDFLTKCFIYAVYVIAIFVERRIDRFLLFYNVAAAEFYLQAHFEPKFQVEGVVPGEYFCCFYKTRHILLSNGANCTVLRAVVLTQYRRVTDGQTDGRTDGIAAANTALAMRALRAL